MFLYTQLITPCLLQEEVNACLIQRKPNFLAVTDGYTAHDVMILQQAAENVGQHTAENTAILISRHTRLNYGMQDSISIRN